MQSAGERHRLLRELNAIEEKRYGSPSLSVASITKTPATVDREQAMRVYDIDIDDTETANNAQTPKWQRSRTSRKRRQPSATSIHSMVDADSAAPRTPSHCYVNSKPWSTSKQTSSSRQSQRVTAGGNKKRAASCMSSYSERSTVSGCAIFYKSAQSSLSSMTTGDETPNAHLNAVDELQLQENDVEGTPLAQRMKVSDSPVETPISVERARAALPSIDADTNSPFPVASINCELSRAISLSDSDSSCVIVSFDEHNAEQQQHMQTVVYTANSAKEHIQNVDIKRDLTVASQPIITRIRSIRASITTESAQIMRDIASVYALNVGNVNELNQ